MSERGLLYTAKGASEQIMKAQYININEGNFAAEGGRFAMELSL